MVSFSAFGHRNIRASHKNTLEFTKDKEVNVSGDCILGVNSDFDADSIKKFLNEAKSAEKMKCRIEACGISDEFEFEINPKFNGSHEIVFRLGEFASERTLGVRASKSAGMIKREIAEAMRNPETVMHIYITK